MTEEIRLESKSRGEIDQSWDKSYRDWEHARLAMTRELEEVQNITTTGYIQEIQEFLTDNFATLSKAQKDFLAKGLEVRRLQQERISHQNSVRRD